ncbi:hypothetical protein ILYODFUR_034218 [Ilyodon furcidens]|uniref:Cystatin domain-containing protein n=1 Tax=Ilyodon furcidens TaxID=33524 RepID=A0ABV0TP60_9TELE
MSCGGWSETKPTDEDVSLLCRWMQNISESETNRTYDEFTAVEYRSQVVAGIKFLVKVHVGENDYVHLMIFQSPLLGNTIETQFLGVQGDHKLEDHLEPFEPSSLNEYLD